MFYYINGKRTNIQILKFGVDDNTFEIKSANKRFDYILNKVKETENVSIKKLATLMRTTYVWTSVRADAYINTDFVYYKDTSEKEIIYRSILDELNSLGVDIIDVYKNNNELLEEDKLFLGILISSHYLHLCEYELCIEYLKDVVDKVANIQLYPYNYSIDALNFVASIMILYVKDKKSNLNINDFLRCISVYNNDEYNDNILRPFYKKVIWEYFEKENKPLLTAKNFGSAFISDENILDKIETCDWWFFEEIIDNRLPVDEYTDYFGLKFERMLLPEIQEDEERFKSIIKNYIYSRYAVTRKTSKLKERLRRLNAFLIKDKINIDMNELVADMPEKIKNNLLIAMIE